MNRLLLKTEEDWFKIILYQQIEQQDPSGDYRAVGNGLIKFKTDQGHIRTVVVEDKCSFGKTAMIARAGLTKRLTKRALCIVCQIKECWGEP